MSPVKVFDETLKELLRDPEQAAQYLRAAMEESDPRALAVAIQDVLQAVETGEMENPETDALCRALSGLKRAGVCVDFLAR